MKPYVLVIIDILRFTTSICTVFKQGVKSVIPVSTIEEAWEYHQKGYLVAGEREGKKLDFAAYGNSPFDFMKEEVKDQTLVYTTTNGTLALNLDHDACQTVCGSFSNISILTGWLKEQGNKGRNLLMLCSGWNKQFCLEDTLFAGCLTERLLETGVYIVQDDASHASLDLWRQAKTDLPGYIEKASHLERLRKLERENSLDFCFQSDTAPVIPVYKDGALVCLNLRD